MTISVVSKQNIQYESAEKFRGILLKMMGGMPYMEGWRGGDGHWKF